MQHMFKIVSMAVSLGTLMAACAPTQAPQDSARATGADHGDAMARQDATHQTPVSMPSDEKPAPSDRKDAGSVPIRFQGNYAINTEACAQPSSESSLTIAADHITFHDGSGNINAVASSLTDLTVTAQLASEGEIRSATWRFHLSSDGSRLTDMGGLQRMRCP